MYHFFVDKSQIHPASITDAFEVVEVTYQGEWVSVTAKRVK